MASAKNSQALARSAMLRLRKPAAAGISGGLSTPQIPCTDVGSSTTTTTTTTTTSPGPSCSMLAAKVMFYPSRRLPSSHILQGMRHLDGYGHGMNNGFHTWIASQASASPALAADPFENEDPQYGSPSVQGQPQGGPSSSSSSGGGEGIDIAKLPISPVLISGLARRGITTLFPVQRAVLEPALKGQDLIARAKTGTGKTLAFGIPILDRIIKENEKRTRGYGRAPLSVVLAPTRELAKQVENELKESAPSIEVVCLYGGVSIETQVRQIQRGVDVAVGTPGRVIDLLDRGSLNLREVQYFVLDEADRMLAVGFEEDVEKILQHLPSQKQSLLFSATMPEWVKKLAGKYLKNHIVVDLVGEHNDKLAEGIKLLSISTTMGARRSMLSDLITVYGKGCKCIVFTQTKREADDVSSFLGVKLGCEALHGDISQHQREKTLKSFRDGRLSVLVATDVAARGLDISNVDLVIHYEPANDSETFVHRSGRTGRAGKQGTAILMHMEQQRRTLSLLEHELGCKFESIDPPSLEDVIRSSAHQAVTKLQSIPADLRDMFLSTAEKLISEQGPGALAAAIAHVCGCTELPTSRSLISYEQGFITLKVTRPGGLPIASAQAVTQFVAQVFPSAANSIGRINMLSESEVQGAVFDLPEKMAKDLLSMSIGTGEIIEAPKKLPKIVEDAFRAGGFGRSFSPGGPAGRFNSGGFSRGGNWSSSSSRSPSSGGGDWSNRSSSGGSDWSNRSSYGSSNWSNRSSSGIDSSSWSSRPSSGYGSTPTGSGGSDSSSSLFSGKCLRCGQVGHRITDCPTSWKPR